MHETNRTYNSYWQHVLHSYKRSECVQHRCSLQMVVVVGQYIQHIVERHRLVAKRRPETNRL
jgi:hypothetical protein